MRQLNKRGMTLIEVVVAIAIFGIVMVTIFPAILVLNLMNTYSFEKLDTTYIAQEDMEEIIFESRNNSLVNVRNYILNTMNYTFQVDESTASRFVYQRVDARYTISVTLTQINSTRLFQLMVAVSSSTNEIEGERVQLETIISLD
ncbi:MAG: type II secretion system protein [Erysipelothrix sp.]|nr:type II secretion system protein [Erysipelothrix sp.]